MEGIRALAHGSGKREEDENNKEFKVHFMKYSIIIGVIYPKLCKTSRAVKKYIKILIVDVQVFLGGRGNIALPSIVALHTFF